MKLLELQLAAIFIALAAWALPWLSLWRHPGDRAAALASFNVIVCGGLAGMWVRFLASVRAAGLGRIHADPQGLHNALGPVLING